jgi:hypothetical protein
MEGRRMIVAVQWGPLDGRKGILAPGETLRVGRSERAGLVVPHDPRMSAVHLELSWDGARGSFRDLKSATGTLRNGEAGLAEGEVQNGDWLKAGETVLTVHVEGQTPARPPDDDSEAAREAERQRAEVAERALGRLADEAAREPLYAVLDAARSRRILELCRESVEDHRSLYDGVEGQTMAHVAPYLVRLPPGSRLFEALVREGWGHRFGIYLTSRQSFTEVRRQLRRFLLVEIEEAEPVSGDRPAETPQPRRERVYFRFYDPRALADFLPSCALRQTEDFFGGIDAFFAEASGLDGGDPGEVLSWRRPREQAVG